MSVENNTLVVDIGNSYIKIGLFSKENKLLNKYLFKTEIKCTKKYLNSLLLKQFGKYKISSSIIGSVVPKQTNNFIRSINDIFNVKPYLINNDTKTSFVMKNVKRQEIGDDIIALAEYCYKVNKTSIGVSFGTAAFALFLKNGELVGAAIAPGIGTSFNLLLDHASLINTNTISKKSNLIYGKNTIEALEAGFNISRSGFVMSFYNNVRENKENIHCIVSGGEAYKLSVDFKYDIDENAILYGFKYIYDLNNN
ncbi:type III pantothenate kinase [Malacoplasma muris]|uniref:type III pantothenate kinase n=1 Tax=Malacoplasma muris TaxID=2119 RepID=UPI00398EEB69